MIKGYKENSNISILNAMYNYPQKDPSTNKWDKGCMTVVYQDNDTNEKHVEEIEDPTYDFFMAKPDVNINHNLFFISKSKVDKVTVPYRDLLKKIAELTGEMQFYKNNIASGNRKQNARLHMNPRIFESDMHVEDKYFLMFDREYQNPAIQPTKAFFDIEYDGINYHGEGIDPEANCPVNAVSIINEKDKRIYSLILRNPSNPLVADFEQSMGPELENELRELIIDTVGGKKKDRREKMKNFIRFGLDKFSFKFTFYDNEINLIADIFNIFNYFKVDFALAWNGISFDTSYLYKRIIKLGYDPKDIMCHPDFKKKFVHIFVDEGTDKDGKRKEMAERGDFVAMASYTVILDQMIHFASRRKGQSKFPNMKLDFIGEVICNVRKLDYSHITKSIAKFPYLDFKLFIFYNIIDTIVQYCIDKKTGDLDYVYSKSHMNNTRYHKAHRQTTYQTNRMAKEFPTYFDDGLILGNNFNCFNRKPNVKYPGAHVAEPTMLDNYPKLCINGVYVGLCNNVVDFDYSAQYPNACREGNMAPHTQIGKIFIDNRIREDENPYKNKYYDRAGAFIECYSTRSILELNYRFFNLASYGELYDDVIEYFTRVKPKLGFTPFIKGKPLMFSRPIDNDSYSKPQLFRQLKDNDKKPILFNRIHQPDYSLADKINVDDYVYNRDKRFVKPRDDGKKAVTVED